MYAGLGIPVTFASDAHYPGTWVLIKPLRRGEMRCREYSVNLPAAAGESHCDYLGQSRFKAAFNHRMM